MARDLNYMKKALIQVDLLKVGEKYLINLDEGIKSRTKPKECMMKVEGCFPDYYLLRDELGIKHSLLKSDLYGGKWKVKGLNPKKKLLEAAQKMEGKQNNIEEEINMKAAEKREEIVSKCVEWLKKHPGEGLNIKAQFHHYNLSYVNVGIIRDTVLKKMQDDGEDIVVEGQSPKLLVYHNPVEVQVEDEIEMTSEEIENTDVEEECEIEMTKEDQLHLAAELAGDALETKENQRSRNKIVEVFHEKQHRKFLEEKREELILRIADINEKLERVQIKHNTEIQLYQELLDEINDHLQGSEA